MVLITPPFTQPNTPYPATTYLTGYLKTLGITTSQFDLGLAVTLRLFSAQGLRELFAEAEQTKATIPSHLKKIFSARQHYIDTIDDAIGFLQGKNKALGYRIASLNLLPSNRRTQEAEEDMEWAFGCVGVDERARHIATLYVEEICTFITTCIDPHFGFSRYAEQMGRVSNTFDEIEEALSAPPTYIDRLMLSLLDEYLHLHPTRLVGFTLPFPGNLYSALRCGKHIKKHTPEIHIAIGGGFVNTELRQVTDKRLFRYVDSVSLDDGEAPIRGLHAYLNGESHEVLVRTFLLTNDKVTYYNHATAEPTPQECGTPSYAGLPLNDYLSLIGETNPMHALWSQGRWLKLTLAHGCYWGKCTFCDTTLPYIGQFTPCAVHTTVDRMETLMRETGECGFHFVDEAAPPALLRKLAEEILRRKLNLSWWTNIRFEKSFSPELCQLLASSGCIAVAGGIEVASPRLLALINKGITLPQVIEVIHHLTQAGIMAHAYLMYGFPGQTTQETIDSLEIVRQLFEEGLIRSSFWHRFALTAHSEIACHPDQFGIQVTYPSDASFALNDLSFEDTTPCDHEMLGEGLRIANYNYMRGSGFDLPLKRWFSAKTPATTLPPNYVSRLLKNPAINNSKR